MKRKSAFKKVKSLGKRLGRELSHSRLGKASRTPIRIKKEVW